MLLFVGVMRTFYHTSRKKAIKYSLRLHRFFDTSFKFQFAGMPPRATRAFGPFNISTFRPIRYCKSKLQFCEPMTGVTFLCPNKKVTKEVGLRGKAALPRDTRSP